MALLADPLALSTDGSMSSRPTGMMAPLLADKLLLSTLGVLSFDDLVALLSIACPPILTDLPWLPGLSNLNMLPALLGTNSLPIMDDSLEYLPTLEDGC